MRAIHTLIALGALLLVAGAATAQNIPCPECDEDGAGEENVSYHSVDIGAIVENKTTVTDEVLADTDMAHANPGDERGFWLWLEICLSAFLQHVEDALGTHTDIDASVEVFADSNGVDLDANVTGLQHECAAVGVQTSCQHDFDDSEFGDLDGDTYETIAAVEATTGANVFVPAVVPDTGQTDTDLCLHVELALC